MMSHYLTFHRSTLCFTLSILIACILSFFIYRSSADAAQVTLAWDPNMEPDLAGYRIYVGYMSRDYDYFMDAGNHTSCVVSGLEQDQMYYFAVTAYDTENLESDFSNEVMATIWSENQPPTADAGPNQAVDEGVVVTLDASNSIDPDNDPLSYSWTQIGGSPVTLDDPTAMQPTFISPAVGSEGETFTFQLTVTDSGGLESTDECAVRVDYVTSGSDLTGSWIYLRSYGRRSRYWILGKFRVENLGSEKARRSILRFYQSIDDAFDKTDIQIGGTRVSLEPGEWVDIPLKTKGYSHGVIHYIIALVDATDVLPEADEDNNVIVSWYLN
jgi:hypothetical protein